MTSEPRADASPFAVGDCVVVMHDIGFIRARVPRGTEGSIAGFTPAGEAEVAFTNGRVELVPLDHLRRCPEDHLIEA